MRITRRYWNGKSDFDVCADDPVAIGEVKKFDEGGSLRRIEEDKRKMCFVARLMRITGFLGVYVTDTRLSYTARLAQINAVSHSSPLAVDGLYRSRDGAWQWVFAVWGFGPEDYDLSAPASREIMSKASRI